MADPTAAACSPKGFAFFFFLTFGIVRITSAWIQDVSIAGKILSSFCLSKFGIVRGRSQPGETGVVMEDRKAAPVLRARFLRS